MELPKLSIGKVVDIFREENWLRGCVIVIHKNISHILEAYLTATDVKLSVSQVSEKLRFTYSLLSLDLLLEMISFPFHRLFFP